MRAALCPRCHQRKIVVAVAGSRSRLYRLRRHHDPSEIDLMKRVQGLRCQGSGTVVMVDDTMEVLP